MELPIVLLLVLSVIPFEAQGAVHDELPQCGLHGVYRQRQSLVESPNYPDNYPVNTCWDYVVRSPYRCPTKFHIQFLDFKLELSENCSRDYLAIGLNNDGDDMEVLCGQVLGIKKYHTLDGVLRLRFLSDDSPWTTNGGFRLLITRLACEREDLVARGLDDDEEDVDGDTVQVSAKSPPKKLLTQHHHHHLPQQSHQPQLEPAFNYTQPNRLGFNLGLQPGLGYPGGLYPPPAGLPPQYTPPCAPQQQQLLQQQQEQHRFLQQQQLQLQILQQQRLQQQVLQQQQLQQQVQVQHPQQLQLPQQQQLQQQELPLISDQYQTTSFQPHAVTLKDYDAQTLQQFGGQLDLCCASSFNQNHFYLSSPGFPRTVLNYLLPNQQRDCVFYIEKSSPNVCRLRIQFKFFDFGQNSGGSIGGSFGDGFGGGVSGGLGGGHSGGFGGQHNCNGDFLELDGQRYCGCRSGYVHKSHWDQGRKALRMRIGQSSSTTSNGFLLEIFQDQDSDGCRQDAGQGFGLGLQPQQPQRGLGLWPQGLQPQLGLQPQFGLQPQLGLPPQTAQMWPLQPGYPGYISGYPLPFSATPYRTARRISYARGIDAQQPSRVVETNSTRKEFYYFDGDEAFARSALDDEDEDKAHLGVTTQPQSSSQSPVKPESPLVTKAFEQSSCSFDYMEVLKLSVDTLWLTKPLCFSPLRSWFPNIFG